MNISKFFTSALMLIGIGYLLFAGFCVTQIFSGQVAGVIAIRVLLILLALMTGIALTKYAYQRLTKKKESPSEDAVQPEQAAHKIYISKFFGSILMLTGIGYFLLAGFCVTEFSFSGSEILTSIGIILLSLITGIALTKYAYQLLTTKKKESPPPDIIQPEQEVR